MVQQTFYDRASRTTTARETDGAGNADHRRLTDLLKELRDETTDLVRHEVTLAKTEISEKLSRVTRNSAYLAIGGVLGLASLVVILLALSAGLYVGLVAAGLSHITAGWLAPSIVGIVTGLIAYAFIQKAISTLRSESLVPERTAQSLREDKEWVERKVR